MAAEAAAGAPRVVLEAASAFEERLASMPVEERREVLSELLAWVQVVVLARISDLGEG